MVQIKFNGAASTVTGSHFLVTSPRGNFVIDCGMFQGPDVEHLNLEPYDYNPKIVDFAILTHAHIDHSGMYPKLYKEGFRGNIYATPHTVQIATLLMLDGAKIQEGNFRRGQPFGKYTDKVAIVYNSFDAEETASKLKSLNFYEETTPKEGITIKFIKSGHVLGAASVEVTIDLEDGQQTKILFSGDIGRVNQSLIDSFDREYVTKPDYILMESLYGGLEHPSRDDNAKTLIEVIKKTTEKNGNVYIPSFSVHRSQEILHEIKLAKDDGRLPEGLNVWLDSPLAQKVSNIYMEALQFSPESLFDFKNLHYVQSYRESQALHRKKGQVIIAGSGMAEGGRILDHFLHGIENKKNSIIFVGFQAEGTLGREITEGAKKISIGKTSLNVIADVHHLTGFSAHGATSDYIEWIKNYNSSNLKKLFLIHAPEERAQAVADKFKQEYNMTNSYIPTRNETVDLV